MTFFDIASKCIISNYNFRYWLWSWIYWRLGQWLVNL